MQINVLKHISILLHMSSFINKDVSKDFVFAQSLGEGLNIATVYVNNLYSFQLVFWMDALGKNRGI